MAMRILPRKAGRVADRQELLRTGDPGNVAKAVGYSDAELATLPEGANMGLIVRKPRRYRGAKAGRSRFGPWRGGGFDVFLVAQKVGPNGRAIGVDMTPEMVGKARRNAEGFRKRTGLDNVEFRLGEIEHLPVADASVDVVISNCVINLSPDKPQVWREVFRCTKPGGRVAVSDLALLKPLPEEVEIRRGPGGLRGRRRAGLRNGSHDEGGGLCRYHLRQSEITSIP